MFPEPALLGVCKQVRKEAGSIFYDERRFVCNAPKYDSTAFAVAFRKLGEVKNHFNVNMCIKSARTRGTLSPNYSNVRVWLRRVHAGILPVPEIDPRSITRTALNAMFVCAEELRDMEWCRVEPILEGMRRVLTRLDNCWDQE